MQRVWSQYLDVGRFSRSPSPAPSATGPAQPSNLNPTSNLNVPNYSSPRERPPRPPRIRSSLVPQPSPINTTGFLDIQSARSPDSSVSLTVNYLPTKFAAPTSARRRKLKNNGLPGVPRGGGVDAFRSGEDRIGGGGFEDDDAPVHGQKLKWTRFKWILFAFNLALTIYSLLALVFCLLTWFNIWAHADIIRVGNVPELVISTIAAGTGLLTSLVGWAGIILNNRAFLAIYSLLTWITFAFLVTPGYITYRRRTFNLEGKINAQWSRVLGTDGRLRIQNQLGCCGYFSPFVEATISASCYARSILPGCKKDYLDWERVILKRWYTVSFTLVPLQIGVMVAALLCSNHVTYRFGKGMMPKRYRLSVGSMAVIMEQYASQLAQQYGSDVASDILKRSRSNLDLALTKTGSYTSAASGRSPVNSSPLAMGYTTGISK